MPEARTIKSAANRAGDRLRPVVRERGIEAVLADDAWRTDLAAVDAWRRSHSGPLGVAAGKLVETAASESHWDVGDRLKRLSRMLEKCARHSTKISRLQDIGGCRIVVPDLAEQGRAVQRVGARFELRKTDDYVASPRATGYRAIHLIVEVDERLLEVQVRTLRQDHWANMVEKAEEITGYALKDGEGPRPLFDYFRVASQLQELKERGQPSDATLEEQLAELRNDVRPIYRRSGTDR